MDMYDWKNDLAEFTNRHELRLVLYQYAIPDTKFFVQISNLDRSIKYDYVIDDREPVDSIRKEIAGIKYDVIFGFGLNPIVIDDLVENPKPMTIEEIDLAMHRLSMQDWFKTEFDDYYYHVTLPELTSKKFFNINSLRIYCQSIGL